MTEEKAAAATTAETPEAKVEADGEVSAETSEDSGATDDGDESTGERRSNKQAVLDEEGDIAADYLEELLDIADLDGDIDTYTEGGRAHVSIVTEGNVLVGKDGEVLDALQELSRLAVMTETGRRSRLMLDVAGHRDKRRAELTDLANDAIEEVKSSGEQVRLSPMNPFERKIVHDVVAAAGLVSESDGEEPNRRVVVLPN
ncbi:Jag family protein [Enemella evansiae]|uniref:Jag family protein n=1 Tax=Enemella evansiae TaxID=2016499 RepID=UPI000B979214|nr:R3H domain-containing nucleic acid-binding protein [Enemella evansiae]OYO02723.1 RNA-binding protein [Enemella evansiae]